MVNKDYAHVKISKMLKAKHIYRGEMQQVEKGGWKWERSGKRARNVQKIQTHNLRNPKSPLSIALSYIQARCTRTPPNKQTSRDNNSTPGVCLRM